MSFWCMRRRIPIIRSGIGILLGTVPAIPFGFRFGLFVPAIVSGFGVISPPIVVAMRWIGIVNGGRMVVLVTPAVLLTLVGIFDVFVPGRSTLIASSRTLVDMSTFMAIIYVVTEPPFVVIGSNPPTLILPSSATESTSAVSVVRAGPSLIVAESTIVGNVWGISTCISARTSKAVASVASVA